MVEPGASLAAFLGSLVRQLLPPLRDTVRELVREELAARDDPRRWLTVPEAARRSMKHADTLRRAIKSGGLPASRSAGSREWRIREDDLSAWMRSGDPARRAANIDVETEIARTVARLQRKP